MSFEYKKRLEQMRQAVLDRGDTKFKTPAAKESLVEAKGLVQRRAEEAIQSTKEQEEGLGLTIASALSQQAEDERMGSLRHKLRPSPTKPMRPRGRTDSYTESDDFNRIKGKLIDRGMPEHIAEAFAFNLKDESGFDSGINEKKPLVPGSRGGFGIYQATGPRRVDLENFTDGLGVSRDDEDAQLDFLVWETQNTERPAYNKVKKNNTVSGAAVSIVKDFLRPSEKHVKTRTKRYSAIGY
jgi:hypothetical protein